MKTLDDVEVLEGLSKESLDDVGKIVKLQKFEKEFVIVSHGEMSSDIYILMEGTVKATTYSFSGKEVAYQTLQAGEIFGELSAIDREKRTTSVVAETNCTIGRISANDFWILMERYPVFMRKIVCRVAGLARSLIGRVYEYSAMSVKGRIRAEIVRLAQESLVSYNSALIKKMPTHESLANRLATHREAVTKEISYLVRNGLIEKDGRALEVPDLSKLISMVEEDI